jgi:hypothetical protein
MRKRTDEHDGVSVGGLSGRELDPDRSSCATMVFDHDSLPQDFRHALGENASQNVGGTAGRKGHHEAQIMVGECLRGGRLDKVAKRVAKRDCQQ